MTTTNDTDFLAGHANLDAHLADASEEPNSINSHGDLKTQDSIAVDGQDSAPATPLPTSIVSTPVQSNLLAGQAPHKTQPISASEEPGSVNGQGTFEAQPEHAVDGLTSTGPANAVSLPTSLAPDLVDSTFFSVADALDDLERTRIANENRLRFLTRDAEDSDGEIRSLGLAEDDPTVKMFVSIVDALSNTEKQVTKLLEKAVKQSPIGSWVAAQKGIGTKQFGRLLAAIDDPYIRPELKREDGTVEPSRPRTVSELWQYCGHGDPLRSRKVKGQRVQHDPAAKMRVHLIAESAVKAGIRKLPDAPSSFTPETREAISPLGKIYHDRRVATWERVHATECVRCGPKGNPAQPGSPWSDGHKQADALRIVGKEILRDLWIESKNFHRGQGRLETQTETATVEYTVE